MNVMMLIGGLIGGMIGLAVWVGVGLAGYEVGWIAWGIGILSGIGTRLFNAADTPIGALSAAAIAGLMVLLGKYVVFLSLAPESMPFGAMFAGWDILWLVLACGTAARLGFVGQGD